jgi:putative membrane protein
MRLLINILITALAAYALSKLLEPHIIIRSLNKAIAFAIILAILNFIIKPLIVILTLPITIVTLGLFLLIINAIIIKLAAHFVSGIKVEGWLWAIIFSLLLSLITTILHRLQKSRSF